MRSVARTAVLLGAMASVVALTWLGSGASDSPVASSSPIPRLHGPELFTPRSRPRPSTLWAAVDGAMPDLDAFIAERASDARDRGLRPVVHLRTLWNDGVTLREHFADPGVQWALHGIYLIEVDVRSGPLVEGQPWSGQHLLCGNFANTFYAVDEDGRPASPVASPITKFGPHTAGENASFLRNYADRLRAEPVAAIDLDTPGGRCEEAFTPW